MDHDRDRPGARIAAAALLWGLGLGLVAGGCHALLPYDNVDARADAPPDMTVDGAARLDGAPPPDAEPTPDVNSTLDAPAGPDQQLADHGPAGDQQPPDMALPDAPLPDQLVPDLPVPDVLSPDTVPWPPCLSGATFSETIGSSTTWVVNHTIGGTVLVKSSYIGFPSSVGGSAFRHDGSGLFCAPSGKGLKIEFGRYCVNGEFQLFLFATDCYSLASCPKKKNYVAACTFKCASSAGTTIQTCTLSASQVATKLVRSLRLYRPGGNGPAKAYSIKVSPTP